MARRRSKPKDPKAATPAPEQAEKISDMDPYSRAEACELIWEKQFARGDFDHLFTDPSMKMKR